MSAATGNRAACSQQMLWIQFIQNRCLCVALQIRMTAGFLQVGACRICLETPRNYIIDADHSDRYLGIFIPDRSNVSDYEYETTRPIEVELEGATYRGTFRVMSGSVIVYYEGEIKFASFGMDRPETVARWLLSDLCRKFELKKRKANRRSG